jgi:hypothetical protein
MNDPVNFYLNSKIIEIVVIIKPSIPCISSKKMVRNIIAQNQKA